MSLKLLSEPAPGAKWPHRRSSRSSRAARARACCARPSTWQYESRRISRSASAARRSASPPRRRPPRRRRPRRQPLRTHPRLSPRGAARRLTRRRADVQRGGGVDQVRRDERGSRCGGAPRAARAAREAVERAGGETCAERGGEPFAALREKCEAAVASRRNERCVGGAAWSHGASGACHHPPALSAHALRRLEAEAAPPTHTSPSFIESSSSQPARLPSSWAQMRAWLRRCTDPRRSTRR